MERLALAMAEHEGWTPCNFQGNIFGSRAYRNHNPGNLRSSPFQVAKSSGFSVFKTDADGWYALLYDLMIKATGQSTTGLTGKSTIKELIYKWAPASDGNNPDSYLADVLKMTGFSADTKLNELL